MILFVSEHPLDYLQILFLIDIKLQWKKKKRVDNMAG